MTQKRVSLKSLSKRDLPEVFRYRDLEARGIALHRFRLLLSQGKVERIGRGLYRRRDAGIRAEETLALVCKKAPGAVVCLMSALLLHGIGTQLPREVWIALDRKARKPKFENLPVRTVRFSHRLLHYEIMTREVHGVAIRITSPARTVVDCFRYRNKFGLDVALEALRDALGSRKVTVDEISRIADFCRVKNVMRPYLEALLS